MAKSQKQGSTNFKKILGPADELSIQDNLFMKGTRIVIPATQREITLGNLHTGHQGIQAIQAMAKTTVYWPGIDSNIEDQVQRCTACLATKPNQKREPLLPHPIPDGPGEKTRSRFLQLWWKKIPACHRLLQQIHICGEKSQQHQLSLQ